MKDLNIMLQDSWDSVVQGSIVCFQNHCLHGNISRRNVPVLKGSSHIHLPVGSFLLQSCFRYSVVRTVRVQETSPEHSIL